MAFFKVVLALFVALIAGQAVAFNVGVPVNRAIARPTTAIGASYVPDGITAEEYAALQKKEADKKVANKKMRAGKKFEDLDTWMKRRDAKFPNKPGAGHTFAKVVDKEKAKIGAQRFLD